MFQALLIKFDVPHAVISLLDSSRSFMFNNDVFFCEMVLLITFLSKTRIKFIYVNITCVYLTEFTLAEPN